MRTNTRITLEFNKANYSIPGMVKFLRAALVDVPGGWLELEQLSPEDFEALVKAARSAVVGVPIFISIIGPDLEMFLYPKPVEPWDMFVESDNEPYFGMG